MRTTIDLDEDIHQATREIALRRGQTMGKVASDLIRKALTQREPLATRNGFPQFPNRPGVIVTMELVNRLRDEEP
jgi:hypothetical protein